MCGAIPTQCEQCGVWWRITGSHNCTEQNNNAAERPQVESAIKQLQDAKKICDTILAKPMASVNVEAEYLQLVLALSMVNQTVSEVLKMLTE